MNTPQSTQNETSSSTQIKSAGRNKKLKYIGLAIFPALALIFMGAGSASAHGMFGFGGMNNATPDQIVSNQQTRFQAEADLLGISVDDVKNAWASGKTVSELATEKGITKDQLKQKMLDQKKQQMAAQLKILVDKGVITQVQADQRLASIQKMQDARKNGKSQGRGRGMMNQ